MKLGFFTMRMHPIGKDWQASLREDRGAFILADQLGPAVAKWRAQADLSAAACDHQGSMAETMRGRS